MDGVDARALVHARLNERVEALCSGAAVVIEGDPFDDESTLFLARLICGRKDLIVRRGGADAGEDEALVRFQRLNASVASAAGTSRPGKSSLRITPSEVQPGDPYQLDEPSMAGKTIDLAFRGGSGYFTQVGVLDEFAALDQSGGASIDTPSNQPPGFVVVTHVRPSGERWMAADASVRVLSAE